MRCKERHVYLDFGVYKTAIIGHYYRKNRFRVPDMKQIIQKILLCTVLLLFAFAMVSVILHDTSKQVPAETPAPPEESVIPTVPVSQVIIDDSADPSEPEILEDPLNTKPQYVFPEDFATTLIPVEWFADCPEPGSVYSVFYNATDYSTGMPITKKMDVYLPYGYSNLYQYDVLILTHGAGCDENYWFSQEQTYNGVPVSAKNLIDNMIYTKSCRQLIVVSCSCRNDISCCGSFYDANQLYLEGHQMSEELKKDILPFLAESFSTYAESSTPESLIAAREHFAFFGFSWSAMFGYTHILPEDLEYISWYGLIAPSIMSLKNVLPVVAEKNKEYPISYLYTSVGSTDAVRKQSESMYKSFCNNPLLSTSAPSSQVIIERAYHSFDAWGTGLFNCLKLFF